MFTVYRYYSRYYFSYSFGIDNNVDVFVELSYNFPSSCKICRKRTYFKRNRHIKFFCLYRMCRVIIRLRRGFSEVGMEYGSCYLDIFSNINIGFFVFRE